MEEAKNQLILQATPTPLQATDRDTTRKLFVGTGYEGVTPATGAIRSTEWAVSWIETPSTPFTPATPGLLHASTKTLTSVDREEIRSQFAALPAPQNEYEASLPEEEEEEEKEETKEEDAEEIERQIREEEAAMEREELARRSEVLKRGLPRGNVIAPRFFVECDEVEKTLKEEMNAIIRYEDYKYPSAESSHKYTEEVTLPVLGYEDKVKAEMMVLEEEGDLKGETPALVEKAYWELWTRADADLMYNPTTKEVVHASALSEVGMERGCDEIGGKSGVLSPLLLVSPEVDHEADEAGAEEREEVERGVGRLRGEAEEPGLATE